jgi:hypothetical protein
LTTNQKEKILHQKAKNAAIIRRDYLQCDI